MIVCLFCIHVKGIPDDKHRIGSDQCLKSLRGSAKSWSDSMFRTGILGLFLLVNAVAIFCAINPWFTGWQAQGTTVLLLEAVFLIVIGVPAIIYQMVCKRKSFKQSQSDTVKAVST